MPRRRRGLQYGQSMQSGTMENPFVPNMAYNNAVEPTHNGNYAWNGQPIPSYQPANPGGQTAGPSQAANPGGQAAGFPSQAANPGGQTAGFPSQAANPGGQTTGFPSQAAYPTTAVGSQPFLPQARDNTAQTFQGGMPVPGASGNQNAAFGQRNTGINNADARNVGFQGGYTGYGPNGQPVQYGTFMRDGTQYGAGPHTIDPNKAIIGAVRYDGNGITAVQFQDGSVADIAQAIAMAEAGLIEDVNTGRNREGQKTLRSYPDGDPSNNLSNLPRF